MNQDGHMTEKATYVSSLLNGSWRVLPTLSLELRLLGLLRGRLGRCIDIGMFLLSRLLRWASLLDIPCDLRHLVISYHLETGLPLIWRRD